MPLSIGILEVNTMSYKTYLTSKKMPRNSSDVCEVQLTRTQPILKYCVEHHQEFSRNCSIFKRDTEIAQIQTNERIPRLQAIRKLLRLNPNPEKIFPYAVKNTSNRTTSQSPSSSEQESQSESSEDKSPTVPSYGHGY